MSQQMWTEIPKGKNKKPVNKDRFISKMFLRCAFSIFNALCYSPRCFRGDSVILSEEKYFHFQGESDIWTSFAKPSLIHVYKITLGIEGQSCCLSSKQTKSLHIQLSSDSLSSRIASNIAPSATQPKLCAPNSFSCVMDSSHAIQARCR